MRQIWIPRYGGPEVLEVRESPDPTPGPGQVRIRVQAAGVNFADCVARMGQYQDAPKGPIVVGYEVAGMIDAVGDGVDAGRVGQAVVAALRFGGYSDVVVLPAAQVLPTPPGMSASIAASIPVVGLTAWMLLIEMGRIREGDRVLIHSAGGGVGLAALDLCRWKGATAVGTASTHKHKMLYERGVAELVDYTKVDFEQALSAGPKFDVILDPVGGASWDKGMRLLKTGGRLAMFGFSARSQGEKGSLLTTLKTLWSVPWRQFNPVATINHNRGVLGVNMGRMWDESERLAGWIEQLMTLWSEGVLRPVIHAEIPFANAREAHRILHARENVGKVLLVP
jgi:NADPH:quinone reductase-like Zn-dependent oxidoreductase